MSGRQNYTCKSELKKEVCTILKFKQKMNKHIPPFKLFNISSSSWFFTGFVTCARYYNYLLFLNIRYTLSFNKYLIIQIFLIIKIMFTYFVFSVCYFTYLFFSTLVFVFTITNHMWSFLVNSLICLFISEIILTTLC